MTATITTARTMPITLPVLPEDDPVAAGVGEFGEAPSTKARNI